MARRPTAISGCDCVHSTDVGSAAVASCLRCLGSGVTDRRRDAVLKHNRERRIPTQAEMLAFDGAHCHKLYTALCADWRCPGCGRSKYELIRWTMLFPHHPDKHPGWAAGLHMHHDHGAAPRRFDDTLMCEQCNSADKDAKRELGLPKEFSFSPQEIKRFVIGTPHGRHLLNYAAAAQAYAVTRIPPPPLLPGLFWPGGG
jgi:hypothetical protein